MNDRVADIVTSALEASLYEAPTDFGLTYAELHEVCQARGLKKGQIDDEINSGMGGRYDDAEIARVGKDRLFVGGRGFIHLTAFIAFTPQVLPLDAMDWVWGEFRNAAAERGRANARLSRAMLVERGKLASHSAHDVHLAMELLRVMRFLMDDGELLKAKEGYLVGNGPGPGSNFRQDDRPRERAELRALLPLVKEAIARRQPGMQTRRDPVDAFPELLGQLNLGQYSIWWTGLSTQLKTLDQSHSSVAAVVLAAALTEAALTFVADAADRAGRPIGKMQGDRRHWKLVDLARAARSGSDPLFNDQKLCDRVEELVGFRKRIHVGGLIDANATAPQLDIRPHEADVARATLVLVLQRLIDWIATGKP